MSAPFQTARRDGIRGASALVLHQQSIAMDVPIGTRRPMRMPVGGSAKRFIETSGRNDRLAPAAGQMRHRAAAPLAERRCKASRLRQIETHDRGFAPQPSQRRGFYDHLAGMRSPAGFPATRAMAVQEAIERPFDLKRDLAAQAAALECRHARLLAWPRPTFAPRIEG